PPGGSTMAPSTRSISADMTASSRAGSRRAGTGLREVWKGRQHLPPAVTVLESSLQGLRTRGSGTVPDDITRCAVRAAALLALQKVRGLHARCLTGPHDRGRG